MCNHLPSATSSGVTCAQHWALSKHWRSCNCRIRAVTCSCTPHPTQSLSPPLQRGWDWNIKRLADCEGTDKRIENQHIQNQTGLWGKDSTRCQSERKGKKGGKLGWGGGHREVRRSHIVETLSGTGEFMMVIALHPVPWYTCRNANSYLHFYEVSSPSSSLHHKKGEWGTQSRRRLLHIINPDLSLLIYTAPSNDLRRTRQRTLKD